MMYHQNGGAGGGLLGVPECSGATPRTPEIVNSLVMMTNPFDRLAEKSASLPPGSSPSPPSVQSTCSKLIKESLKLTLDQKKKRNNSTCSLGSEGSPLMGGRATSPDSQTCDNSNDGLTPEDEERRRRRRERNKIAATKCRQKKRERTNNLVYESEILETQNLDLKSKIQELEKERRKLVDFLEVHQTRCTKHPFTSPPLFQECMGTEYTPGGSYPSSSFEVEVCSSETSTSSYHHSRMSTVIKGAAYPSPYAQKEVRRNPFDSYYCPQARSEEMVHGRDYNRGPPYPLRLANSSSSSDYESNTELLDSPVTSAYHINDDPSSYSSSSSSIFPSSSCIT